MSSTTGSAPAQAPAGEGSVAPDLDLASTVQVVDLDQRVHRITLSNPDKMNAFTGEMYGEVRDGILHAYADERVEAVVIDSVGRAFASGGDLKHFLEVTSSGGPGALPRTDAAYGRPPFRAALRCPKPVICVVDGLCMAGGLILAACSDIVIATRRATFSVPEAKVGIFDPFVTEILPLVIGLSRARYLAVTSAVIDADTAERWGLVTVLVDDADAAAVALDEALSQVRAASPTARALYKRGMTAQVPDTDLLENFRVALTRNGREGLEAFRDHRAPAWEPLTAQEMM